MSLTRLSSSALLFVGLLLPSPEHRRHGAAAADEGKKNAFNMAMVPKFAGFMVFDQAFSGANKAFQDLGSPGVLEYIPPPASDANGAAQIDIVQRATITGFDSILISNNAGDSIEEACVAATEADIDVIAWDSPIAAGVTGGERVFVSPVDFDQTGQVMADMAVQILPSGGKFAISSASAVSANQNAWNKAMLATMEADPAKYGKLELVELLHGDGTEATAVELANYLMDTYPDLKLIMSPTTVGIAGTSKAVTERGMCGTLKVSGLGLPAEMVDYTLSGCAPLFALWSFVDLGYLTYYAAYRLAAGAFEVHPGATFDAGRLGTYAVQEDPTRPDIEAYRVLLGDFTLYDARNVEDGVFFEAIQGDGGQDSFEQRFIDKYKKKAISIIPKVTGTISFLFSGYILWHILSNRRKRRETKNRLLVGISVHDMISSFFGFFLSTWPIPADTWLIYGNAGTTQTCTMQGFFFQAGISASPLYSASLTTFYLLNVVFECTNDTMVKRAEPFLHAVPILFGWGTAFAGLPLTLYNAADRVGFMCWIAEYPAYCSLRDSCVRGENANTYRWAFLYAWVLAVFLYMALCMLWIYHKVLTAERATDRWTRASGQRRRRNLSAKVASQGLQYVVAFIFPWIFGITVSILLNETYGDISASAKLSSALTSLEIVNAFIWPLKGFFTFLVYMGPSTKGRRQSSAQQSQSYISASSTSGEESGHMTRNNKKGPFLSITSFITKSKLFRSFGGGGGGGGGDSNAITEENNYNHSSSLKVITNGVGSSTAEIVAAAAAVASVTAATAANTSTASMTKSECHPLASSETKKGDSSNDAEDIYDKKTLIKDEVAVLMQDAMVDTLVIDQADDHGDGSGGATSSSTEAKTLVPAANAAAGPSVPEASARDVAGQPPAICAVAEEEEEGTGHGDESTSQPFEGGNDSISDLRTRVTQQLARNLSLRDSLRDSLREDFIVPFGVNDAVVDGRFTAPAPANVDRSKTVNNHDKDDDDDDDDDSLAGLRTLVEKHEAYLKSLRDALRSCGFDT